MTVALLKLSRRGAGGAETFDLSIASIPDDVRAFIAEHIRSVVELEMLLALQADPARAWLAAEVSKEMRLDAAGAEPQLQELSRRGLLQIEAGTENPGGARYRYAPASPAIDDVVRRLAQTYADLRVSVIEFIFSMPEEPIRNFANAFRLRKERPDG